MSEMVERVARALWEVDTVRPDYERAARAAIEAMREPTEEMLATLHTGRCDTEEELAESYRDMIDAALADEKQDA